MANVKSKFSQGKLLIAPRKSFVNEVAPFSPMNRPNTLVTKRSDPSMSPSNLAEADQSPLKRTTADFDLATPTPILQLRQER